MKLDKNSLIPILCVATGRCCIHNLVILSPFDIFRMGKFLEKTAKQLFEEKIITYRINQTSFWMEPMIYSNEEEVCPFLEAKQIEGKDKFLCKIYEARPIVCRIYPLKYDKEENSFLRFFPAEDRCKECIDFDNFQSTENFLNSGSVPSLLEDYKKFDDLLKLILNQKFDLNGIKNNKEKQKKFFEIQKILYETYPNNEENFSEYPFEKVKLEILAKIY